MPVDGDVILKAGLDTSSITKSIGNLSKSISKGLKTTLRLAFGVRSVFALIRKMRSALIDGFEGLAQVHEPFNRAMSELTSSLNLLKNTFAAAFAPIIETVAPILSKFIVMVANAVSVVGQFIATLTGKEYVNAGMVWQDYASSVDKSTSNTKKQTKATNKQTEAQKKLNREITHFDDLVILHDKDKDDTDTTTAPATPSYSFNPALIGKAVSDFANEFKAALATMDFTEIGRKISDKLATELERIEWEPVYEGARNFGTGLATFLNGLISPRLFGDVGDTVGSALNTALHFLDSFGDSFSFTNFGTSLGNGLKRFFRKWDANLTANVFSKFVNGLADTIKSALNEFPAQSVGNKIGGCVRKALKGIQWNEKVFPAANLFGKKLAKFLNGLISVETFKTVGSTVANCLNTALHILDNFGETFNFTEFGASIGSALGTFFNTWDADLTADVFSTFVNGLADTIKSALDNFPTFSVGGKISSAIYSALSGIQWETKVFPAAGAFGTKLAQFLNGLFKKDTFTKIGTTVSNLISTALEVLNKFGDTFNFNNFGKSLASGFNAFLTSFPTAKLNKGISSLVRGIRTSIVSFLSSVSWYSFGVTLRDILTGLPWKTLLTGLGTVIWQAINVVIETLKGVFDTKTISGPVADTLESLKTTVNDISSKIDFATISDGFDRIVAALTPAGENFAAGFLKVFDVLFEIGSEFLEKLGPALQTIAGALEEFDPTVLEAIGTALGTVFGAIAAFKGAELIASAVQSLVSPFTGLVGALTAHPLLGIAVGVTALATACGKLIDSGFFSDADTKVAIKNANDVITTANDVQRNVSDALDTVQGKDRDIDATYGVIRNLAKEYFALKGEVNLTKEEEERLKELEEQLSSALPGFQEIIGNTTSSYDAQKQEVNKLITSTEEYYKTLAAQEYLKTYYENMFKLEVEIQKNRDAHKKLVEAYDIDIDRSTLLGGVIGSLADLFDGTKGKIAQLDTEYVELTGDQKDLYDEFTAQKEILNKYGIEVDDVTGSMSDYSDETKTMVSSTEKVQQASADADKDTSGFAETFKLFDGLSIATPLKMALLTAAIKGLGDRGSLSEEDVNKLYSTLNEYDAAPTESNMQRVGEAFDNTGIDAKDFVDQLAISMMAMDTSTQQEVSKVIQTIQNSAPDLKAESETAFENVGDGAKEGIDAKSQDVIDAGGDMMDDTINKMNEVADAHSPSERTKTLGGDIGEGLKLGMEGKQNDLNTTADSLISGILSNLNAYSESFKTAGTDAMTDLKSGMSGMSSTLNTEAYDIASDIYSNADSVDFKPVGENVGWGMYNGLNNTASTLYDLAWDVAYNMYISACQALGIASPSKEFAWVGDMITRGLGEGIIDNEDNAIDPITDMTDAMTEEAEKTNPSIAISTSIEDWINSLESVLTKFSETIINRFDNLMGTLVQLSSASLLLPDVAQGKVIPSSIRSISSSSSNTTDMMQMLQNLTSNQITIDDLRPLLIEMFTEYMNLGWYIGDEQLARHANNGNLLLDRKYSIIRT